MSSLVHFQVPVTPPHASMPIKSRVSTPHPRINPEKSGRVSFSNAVAPTPMSLKNAPSSSAALKARQATPFSKSKENISFAADVLLSSKPAVPSTPLSHANAQLRFRQATPFSHPKEIAFSIPSSTTTTTPRAKPAVPLFNSRKSTPFVAKQPSAAAGSVPRMDSAMRIKAFVQKRATTPASDAALPEYVKNFIAQRNALVLQRSVTKAPPSKPQWRVDAEAQLAELRPYADFTSWSDYEIGQRLQAAQVEARRNELDRELLAIGLSPSFFDNWDNDQVSKWIELETRERLRGMPLRHVFRGQHTTFAPSPLRPAAVLVVEPTVRAEPVLAQAVRPAAASTDVVDDPPSAVATLVEETFRAMTCVQLKAELKSRGLATSGLKKDLVERLVNA